MIDIRIVCTHDAVKTAQTLRRLLEAELHTVDVSFGRHSLDHFESALNSHEIALLIWSKVKLGVTPDINALATLMVSIVAVGVLIAGIVMNRAEHRRQQDEQMAFRANG